MQLDPEPVRPGWIEQRPAFEGYVFELLDGAGAVVHSAPLHGDLAEDSGEVFWRVSIVERPSFVSYRIRHQGRTVVEYGREGCGPESSEGGSGGGVAQGDAEYVPTCIGSDVDEGLPQGHAESGFDGAAVGMLEVFAGLFHPSSGRFSLEPVWLVPESARPGRGEQQPVVEGYVLDLLDATGEVVHRVPLRGQMRASGEVQWEVSIVERPSYVSYRVHHEGRAVVESARSVDAPRISGPKADLSEALGNPDGHEPLRVRFGWRACDPDAGPLHQRTYYTTDGGLSYSLTGETHRLDEPDSAFDAQGAYPFDTSVPHRYSHTVAPWNLAPAERARFLVVVSDGVRWSAAMAPEFEPAPHPTVYVTLYRPIDGEIYGPDDEIVLAASASGTVGSNWDVLADRMFHWSSDTAGEIAPAPTTERFRRDIHGRVPPGFLAPGTHRITATAIDEQGNTGSATVTIEVMAS